MRILVAGAGVLGCNLARNLFRVGKDVTLLARGKWADLRRKRKKGASDGKKYFRCAEEH